MTPGTTPDTYTQAAEQAHIGVKHHVRELHWAGTGPKAVSQPSHADKILKAFQMTLDDCTDNSITLPAAGHLNVSVDCIHSIITSLLNIKSGQVSIGGLVALGICLQMNKLRFLISKSAPPV